MNSLRYFLILAVAMGASTPVGASPSLLVALPNLSALTLEAGSWVTDELRALRSVLSSVPRLVRANPTVSVVERANHILVVASRLPSDDHRSMQRARSNADGMRRGH